MARIREEHIRAARETPIHDTWSRLGLPDVRTSAAFRSPFREDKKPSCQLGGAKNIFFDHATSESLDPIALVRKARECSFKEAVAFVLGRPLDDLLELQARPNSQKTSAGGSPPKQLQPASHASGGSPPDAIDELARVRGWRPEAIRALGAESRNAQAPREVHFPMRDGAGAVVGFRRRRSDGKPFSNGSKAMSSKGAKNGLLCPWPLPEEGPVLVVEGEADACAAMSAGFAAVVATPGASVPKMVVSALQKIVTRREVVLFPDPDEAGRGWLERVGRALANARCAVRFAPADEEDLDKRLKHESNPREALEALIRDAALFVIRDGNSGRRPQSNLTPLILPNEAHGERLSDTARMLFPVVAPKHVFFQRGGKMVEVAEVDHEMTLNILGPDAFRSRIERHFEVVVYRSGPNDSLLLKPTVCPCDTARALMETLDARHDLPSIAGISGCPLIDAEGRVLGKGYDPKTGWFIASGETPPDVPLEEATAALSALLDDFDFVCPGDRSRALASIITPALRLGGMLNLVPCDVAEANASQSGKTYRQKVIAAIYNETPRLITQRQSGGVGSFDESLSARLAEGRPFIQMDNLRGKLDSPNLEAFMTSERAFPVRVPHKGEMMIDPSRFFIFVSSNGFETTRDFANRSSIVRIRKRPRETVFLKYPEGDLLTHVRAWQPYYLGCVFAVVRAWLDEGKPRTHESRHSFQDWACSLDWIVQNIFGAAPLLDGHDNARDRVSDPGKGFIRAVAAHLEEQGKLGQEFTASEIYEMAEENNIDIPGLRRWNETSGRCRVGSLISKTLDGADSIEIDGYKVTLIHRDIWRPPHSDHKKTKFYLFCVAGEHSASSSDLSEDADLLPF
ncbi:toprim domain-containing protein [bacterium]|nr:toprim domain-containing protein [bacterium]